MSAPRELVRRLWPETVLLLATVAVFAQVLFTRATIFARDIGPYFAPMRAYWRGRVLEGELPEWLPGLGLGVPFLADPANQSFYPPVVLTLLPAAHGLDLYLVAHVLLAGLGALLLARAVGARPVGAFVAGISFGLGGYMVSMTTSCLYLCSAAYTPWVALAGLSLRRKGKAAIGVVALAGALALQLLAGDFQSSMIAVAITIPLALVAPGPEAGRPSARSVVRLGLLFGAAVALSGIVAAAQLLPSWILAAESVRRDGVPLEIAQIFSTHPLRLLGVVVPGAWGSPIGGPYYAAGLETGGKTMPWALSLYAGAGASCLVPLGLALAAKEQRRLLVILAALAAVLVALALGSHTPLYALAHRTVPLFAMFRYPEKLFAGAALVVALLSGLGASLGAEAQTGRRLVAVASGGLLPLTLAVGGVAAWAAAGPLAPLVPGLETDPARGAEAVAHLGTRALLAGLVAAAVLAAWLTGRRALLALCFVVDLSVSALAVQPVADLTESTLAPPLAARARRGAEVGEPMRLYDMRGGFSGDPARAEQMAIATAEPNRGLPEGVGHLNPYSASMPNSAETLLVVGARHPARLCAIASATAVLADRPRYERGPFAGSPPAAELGPLVLVDLPRRLPRGRVLGAAVVARSEAEAGALLWHPEFPAERVALLIGHPPSGLPVLADDDEPPEPRACEVLRYEPETVGLRCEADGPSVVVLADQFTAGWTVEVDGERRALLRAEYAMRGVVVGAGRHDLVFRYRAPGLSTGLGVSAAGLVGLVALLVAGRGRRRA